MSLAWIANEFPDSTGEAKVVKKQKPIVKITTKADREKKAAEKERAKRAMMDKNKMIHDDYEDALWASPTDYRKKANTVEEKKVATKSVTVTGVNKVITTSSTSAGVTTSTPVTNSSTSTTISHPSISAPVSHPSVIPSISAPVSRPSISHPSISRPSISHPSISAPISRPSISHPSTIPSISHPVSHSFTSTTISHPSVIPSISAPISHSFTSTPVKTTEVKFESKDVSESLMNNEEKLPLDTVTKGLLTVGAIKCSVTDCKVTGHPIDIKKMSAEIEGIHYQDDDEVKNLISSSLLATSGVLWSGLCLKHHVECNKELEDYRRKCIDEERKIVCKYVKSLVLEDKFEYRDCSVIIKYSQHPDIYNSRLSDCVDICADVNLKNHVNCYPTCAFMTRFGISGYPDNPQDCDYEITILNREQQEQDNCMECGYDRGHSQMRVGFPSDEVERFSHQVKKMIDLVIESHGKGENIITCNISGRLVGKEHLMDLRKERCGCRTGADHDVELAVVDENVEE